MKIVLVHSPLRFWKRPLSLIGFLIRKFTKTYYNHASFLVEIAEKKFILESDIEGVVLVPYEHWCKEQVVTIYDFDANTEHLKRALSKVSVSKYDFVYLFWFGLVRAITGKYYGYTVERKAAKKFYCYEYLAWVIGLEDYYKILPNEFITFVENQGYELVHEKINAKDLL
jgi:hypothetical protein